MSMPAELIAECEGRGVRLDLGESSAVLTFDAPPGALTPELRAELIDNKPDVLQLLFEREERAALQDAPEWMDAALWARVGRHPGVLCALATFRATVESVERIAEAKERAA